LDVGRASARIVDRLAIHGDAHEVQSKRVLWAHFSGQARDIHTFIVVEHGKLVVDDLNDHVRALALNETGIDDIAGMHVSASLIFHLRDRKLHLLGYDLHRSACARCGQADVVAIHHGRAAIQTLIARIANEAHAYVRLARKVANGLAQLCYEIRWNHGRSLLENHRLKLTPWRVIDLRHVLGARLRRTQLGLVGQFLEWIVVPELHFHTTIQAASLDRCVRA